MLTGEYYERVGNPGRKGFAPKVVEKKPNHLLVSLKSPETQKEKTQR